MNQAKGDGYGDQVILQKKSWRKKQQQQGKEKQTSAFVLGTNFVEPYLSQF